VTDVYLSIDGPIVPKARPRFSVSGKVHMPENYRAWKQKAIRQLRRQYVGGLIEQAEIEIILHGKHSRRGDCDNISGSLLDALVQAKILRDDNMVVVSALSVRLEYHKDLPPVSIVRILAPA
jgi:Holliday junction resolvase RusA-like endonuclease